MEEGQELQPHHGEHGGHGGLLEKDLTDRILASAFEVHSVLGPGLLENAYRDCLAMELELRGIRFRAECPVSILYKDRQIENAFRVDLIVEERVLVELKAVEKLLPVHEAQVLTYLKLSGIRVGLLLNFHERQLRRGLRRLVS